MLVLTLGAYCDCVILVRGWCDCSVCYIVVLSCPFVAEYLLVCKSLVVRYTCVTRQPLAREDTTIPLWLNVWNPYICTKYHEYHSSLPTLQRLVVKHMHYSNRISAYCPERAYETGKEVWFHLLVALHILTDVLLA